MFKLNKTAEKIENSKTKKIRTAAVGIGNRNNNLEELKQKTESVFLKQQITKFSRV